RRVPPSGAQHQPGQGRSLPQQHLPDVLHLSPPSAPGTGSAQSSDSPPPGQGRVPLPTGGAAAPPSLRRSIEPAPPRRRRTPAPPGAGSSPPAPGRCTAGPAPGAPPPAPGSPARSPAAARPWAAAARPAPPSCPRLDPLGGHRRHLLRHHGVQLPLLLDGAPLAAAVDDLPVRLADHQGEVPQLVEVDAV